MSRYEAVRAEQPDLFSHAIARDRALDLLEAHRGPLVSAARRIAIEIERTLGRVSSPEVLRELRRRGYDIDSSDRRFMGAVFREGWVRIGWEPTGSHCRPVPIWKLKQRVAA